MTTDPPLGTDGPASTEPHLRQAVRALLVDPDRRVLLARFELPALTVWAAPGGGIEPGETSLAALRRELREEVGFDLTGEPPLVWHRRAVVPGTIEGHDGQEEDYHLVPTPGFTPRGDLTDEQLAAEHLVELRWWGIDEITAATGTIFAPRGLGVRLRRLLDEGPPDSPIQLGT